jgi:hypothetical protein
MLPSSVSLDLGGLVTTGKFVAAGLFFVLFLFLFLVPWLRGKKASAAPLLKRKSSDRSSDAPAPSGFAEHLRIIEETASNADASVWWEYAKAELTEAEVAIAEAKLARRAVPMPKASDVGGAA